jgi:hypothetical protein
VLVTVGLGLAAFWPKPAAAPEAPQQVEDGKASRLVFEDCDPAVEARKYEAFVDRRALAVLSWQNMSERAANLKIPVYVKSVDDGVVNVSILEIPMREQYLTIWQNSGHIAPSADGTFQMDPCSASIEAWEAMDQATAGDE